jgi:hypothetical protein
MSARVLVPLAVALLWLAAAEVASANSQAYRYVTSSCCTLLGVRSTILTPNSQEAIILPGDWELSSAQANEGGASPQYLLQAGAVFEYAAPQDQTCSLGSSTPTLYYFVEKEVGGIYLCYQQGALAWSHTDLYSDVRGSDGIWRAYINSVYKGISVTWSNCGGNACIVSALGEKRTTSSGYWPAKFAGSGNTPWQRWTGSTWSTIQQYQQHTDANWTWSGPFPTGIWSATYSK